jgi:lipoate-protein ligase A
MAVDWWLLRTTQNPSLRFYKWAEPAISIGYRQQYNPPEELSSFTRNHTLVVRPSGGGYLYHHSDLSFSVVMPSDTRVSELGIKDSYNELISPIIEAAKTLNLIESVDWGEDNYDSSNCLKHPSSHEPTVSGSKWLASAQARRKRNLLQQGSLFWEGNWPQSLEKSQPKFLKPDSGSTTIYEFRNEIIRNYLKDLSKTGTIRHSRLSRTEWDEIMNLRERLRVDSVSNLPVFDRFSTDFNPGNTEHKIGIR